MATNLYCVFFFSLKIKITVNIITSRQRRIPLLLEMYHISFSALLNPDPLPVVTWSPRGCSSALVSWRPLMGAGSANLHCAGWGSICKGLLGLLPDFFKCCLETKQYYLTPPDLQCRTHCTRGKEFFLFLFPTFFLLQEITHFSAVGEGSNWSRALQLAFRNGFILNVEIKLC